MIFNAIVTLSMLNKLAKDEDATSNFQAIM